MANLGELYDFLTPEDISLTIRRGRRSSPIGMISNGRSKKWALIYPLGSCLTAAGDGLKFAY